MEIICPECQFARQVDESKIPARSQLATCPKCRTKFQFRELPEEDPIPAPEPASALEEPIIQPLSDDPVDNESAPEAEAEDAGPSGPSQATLPMGPTVTDKQSAAPVPPETDETEPVFPSFTAPGERPKEELWDKLHDMTPPGAGNRQPTQEPEPARPEYAEHDTYAQPTNQPGHEDQATPPSYQDQQAVPGWTGEFNEDFPDPMQEDFHEEDEDDNGPLVPPPFEQLDRYGFFNGLYMTIKLVLTAPRLFFSVMPVGGGLAKPLTFTILLTMVQSFSQYFWGMAGLSNSMATEGEPVAGISGALAPLIMLLLMPALIAAGQFVMTAFYHILLVIMRSAEQGFEGTFRALTYSNAPIILGLFPMPMKEIEMGWMFVVAIWGLILTIIGLKYVHKSSYAKVIPVALIPLLLAMIAGLAAFQSGMTTI